MKVDFFDPAGRRIRLLNARLRSAGVQRLAWDGRDDTGRRIPCGVHLYRVKAAGIGRTGRVQILR